MHPAHIFTTFTHVVCSAVFTGSTNRASLLCYESSLRRFTGSSSSSSSNTSDHRSSTGAGKAPRCCRYGRIGTFDTALIPATGACIGFVSPLRGQMIIWGETYATHIEPRQFRGSTYATVRMYYIASPYRAYCRTKQMVEVAVSSIGTRPSG